MGRNDLCFCGSGKKMKKCHSDIENDSAFAKTITFHNKASKLIQENTQFDKLKCKKGCAECCYQNFPISTVEFYYLMYRIWQKHGMDKVKEYVTKGYNSWCEYEKEFPENAKLLKLNAENANPDKFNEMMKLIEKGYNSSPMYNKFPCPFLNVEGGFCDVYEDRPFVCRHFGTGYVEKQDQAVGFCSHTLDGIMYEDYMADLRGLKTEAMEMDAYYSPKYKKVAYDRSYPIFYYCKITYEHFDNLEFKIKEMKDLTKEKFSDNRIDRIYQRQRK